MDFLDRQREIRVLDQAWEQQRAVFCTLAGRRRVGKSRLLSQFLRDRSHVYLTGTQQSSRAQLVDASREIYRVTQDPLLASQDLTSWDAVLAYLTQAAQARRLGIVFDEFSYYCDASPSLPSLVQRWWDRTAQNTSLFFILADSHLSFMDRLVAGDQPLFGRRTLDLRLSPFDYADAARFFPTLSAVNRLQAYAVFGGMPAYLAVGHAKLSLAENIRDGVLADGAPLRHEPDFLFSQERSVKDPTRYRTVLRAIAAGQTQPNEIAQAAGYHSPTDIAGILRRLQDMQLIERLVPIRASDKGRISRYVVADPFLAFWFRFVQPAETLLEQGLASLVLQDLFDRDGLRLDEFVSRPQGPWETACASYLWRAQRANLLGDTRFDALGCWWEGRGAHESGEIDLVGSRGNATVLLASCKWRRSWTKLGDLQELRALGQRQVGADNRTRYVLFSRSGFDPNLVAVAQAERVLLVTPDDMFTEAIVNS